MVEQKRSSGCFGKLLRGLGIIVLVVIVFLAGLLINQQVGLARARDKFPAPGKLVQVEGHLIHLRCTGEGAPIVVIDAGNSSLSIEWFPIQDQLSQVTRVCTYDRPGYGWSEPGPERRDGMQVAAELHALLQAAGEHGPFVLVGHSLGGVHVRIYAAEYPKEVAGMVLVDAPYPLIITPEYEGQMQASIGFYQVMNLLTRSGIMRILGPLGGESSMPETARKLPAELQETYLNLLLDPVQYRTAIFEMTQLPQTFEQASQLAIGEQPLGDLPLIVLTAGQMAAPGSTPFDAQQVPVSEQRIAQQAELAATSSRGEQRVLDESGHAVHLDAPQAVVQAVRDVVEMID